jgi:hypothetical protein
MMRAVGVREEDWRRVTSEERAWWVEAREGGRGRGRGGGGGGGE